MAKAFWMKSLIRIALVAAIITPFGSARADNGGDDDGETANYSFGFGSSRNRKSIDGSVSYSRYLTEDVYFNFDTSLKDEYNTYEKRSIENRSVISQVTFDPASPWYLRVSYRNSKNYNYRPPGIDIDEYKALTITNSLSSSLRYTFRDDVRTYMDVSLSKSRQESIVAGEPTTDTSGETKRISFWADYDLTSNTVLSGKYEGGVNKNTFVGSSNSRTDPPTPARRGRTRTNRLIGSLSSTNDLTDSVSLDTSVNVNLNADRDDKLKGLTKDALSGNGSASVMYQPASEFTLEARSNVSRSKTYYPFKDDYEDTFGARIFDSVNKSLDNSATVTISPSPQVSTDVSYERSDTSQRRFDENDVPPNPVIYPDAVKNIHDKVSETVRSNVDLSIGEDMTFHLSYYLSTLETDYILDPTLNTKTLTNNLNSNIGYDFTDTLRADVVTNLGINKDTYDDLSLWTGNSVNSGASITNTFTFKVSDDTRLAPTFYVKANRTKYEYNPGRNSEFLDRYFSGTVSHEFSDMFDVSFTAKTGVSYTSYPYKSRSNREKKYYTLNPSTVLDFSDALTLRVGFTFSRNDEWYPNEIDWEASWQRIENYTTNLSATYRIFEDFNVNFNAINTHQLRVNDKIIRTKTYPDESYFNVSASASYQW
ncbi:MAG: hypothetical protein JSW52_01015 [Candidatus Coatesbacteria bacterium]|nr:MAG: hypothetical protein JSW52_01015 [Candidatus Coatesbacteria bacterium]